MSTDIDHNTKEMIEETRDKHEFLTFLVMDDELKMGVVQNETQKIIMFYDLRKINDPVLRERFIEYADQWWWQSNRSIPINSFIGPEFDVYRECLTGYPKKSVSEMIGPTFSIADLYLKRIKRKRIDLIVNRSDTEAS